VRAPVHVPGRIGFSCCKHWAGPLGSQGEGQLRGDETQSFDERRLEDNCVDEAEAAAGSGVLKWGVCVLPLGVREVFYFLLHEICKQKHL